METQNIESAVNNFNAVAKNLGLLPLAIVNPKECKGQEKNARYFKPETFRQLVENVKKYGHLESVPLVYKDAGGAFRIISGHHRIDAAREAGLNEIIVFVDNPQSQDEITAKQLAHNSLEGKDDPVILAELFNSIDNVDFKLETGLESELEIINYDEINVTLPAMKEITFMFMPDDYDFVRKNIDLIADITAAKTDGEILLASLKIYDKFAELLMQTKKHFHVKNNAVALCEIVNFVSSRMDEFTKGAERA